jgi:dihydrofolate reductase
MPWHFSEDLKYFKKQTLDHSIVMGRKTFDSLGGLLPRRCHLVLTRDRNWEREGVEKLSSFEDVFEHCRNEERVFVIGGGEIYALALPYADELYLTEIHEAPEGDVFFPFWEQGDWQEVFREDHDRFSFCRYQRKQPALRPEKAI